jgi:hypothetical protein
LDYVTWLHGVCRDPPPGRRAPRVVLFGTRIAASTDMVIPEPLETFLLRLGFEYTGAGKWRRRRLN